MDGNLYNKDQTELIQYAIGKTEASFTIPDSVTSIGGGAFEDCSSLTEVIIPDSVMSICKYAFYGCGGLTKVVIGDNVTSIGGWAFAFCAGLTEIVISDTVTSIGNDTLYNCFRLASITFEGTIEQWNEIEKGSEWNDYVPATQVVCTNGTVQLR